VEVLYYRFKPAFFLRRTILESHTELLRHSYTFLQLFFLFVAYHVSYHMVNTAYTQFRENSVPRRYSTANGQRILRDGRQDNPTPPRDRTASPQPDAPKKILRPHPFDTYKDIAQKGRPKQRQTKPTTIHLKLRVSSELERKAEELRLSVSATGAALIEWALQQSIYQQNTATLDAAIDKAIGRHMRTYSDRNAGLQARNLQKTELVFSLVTNILGRMPGMDEETITKILSDADDAANASITRATIKQRKIVEAEREHFDGKGGWTAALRPDSE